MLKIMPSYLDVVCHFTNTFNSETWKERGTRRHMPEFSVFHVILDTTGFDASMQLWIYSLRSSGQDFTKKKSLLTPSEWAPKQAAQQRKRVLEKNGHVVIAPLNTPLPSSPRSLFRSQFKLLLWKLVLLWIRMKTGVHNNKVTEPT